MEIRPIRSPEDHAAALCRLDGLMDAEAGTAEADELEVLALLIDAYERNAFALTALTPLEVIEFRMEQGGLTQADLAAVLGSRSRASEILNGKSELTLTQIRKLRAAWDIPADLLIGQAGHPTAAE